MKKNNLLLALSFICLAVLVAVGSVFATAAQVAPMRLAAASATETKTIELFKNNGDYAVSAADLKKAKNNKTVYSFFGYDWRVVYVNGNVATFWMVAPCKNVQFADRREVNEGNYVWANGYTKSVWKSNEIKDSNIRRELRVMAEEIKTNEQYKKAAQKIIPGYVEGTNEKEDNYIIENVYNSVTSSGIDYEHDKMGDKMTAYYGLDETDVLWLPSDQELKTKGLWNLKAADRTWEGSMHFAWLRTPGIYSVCGVTIDNISGDFEKAFDECALDNAYGLRPAVHLDISSLNKAWGIGETMKVFFIVVCSLGIIGVVLVIVAVVRKNRAQKQQAA